MTDRTTDCGSIAARVRVVIGALETAADAAELDLRDDVLVGIDQLRVVLAAAAQRTECRSVDLSVPDVERIVAWASLWRGYHDPHWSPDDDELFSRLQCIAFGLTEQESEDDGVES